MIDELQKIKAKLEEYADEMVGKSFVYNGLTGRETHFFEDSINNALDGISDLIGVIQKYSEE